MICACSSPTRRRTKQVLYAQLKRAVRPESVAGRGEELRHEKEPRLAAAATEEDQQKLIADLTRQLENMGPVNLEAVQEYDELEERYRFLETQNTDLTNSRVNYWRSSPGSIRPRSNFSPKHSRRCEQISARCLPSFSGAAAPICN